jgi:hypothetical protein
MTKGRELELRIVEVKESLAPTKLPGPIKSMKRRPAPTRAEALEALRATKGAASLIERIAALGQPGLWGEVASWNACQTTGAAAGDIFIWGCDFPGAAYNMFTGYANCVPYFAGKETLGGITPPQNVVGVGQVWCYLNAPLDGLYLFVVQMETYPWAEDSNLVATIECLIDSNYPLGEVKIPIDTVVNQPFVVGLTPGLHTFVVAQVSGAFFFQNLTAWTIPVIKQ